MIKEEYHYSPEELGGMWELISDPSAKWESDWSSSYLEDITRLVFEARLPDQSLQERYESLTRAVTIQTAFIESSLRESGGVQGNDIVQIARDVSYKLHDMCGELRRDLHRRRQYISQVALNVTGTYKDIRLKYEEDIERYQGDCRPGNLQDRCIKELCDAGRHLASLL